MLSFSGNSPKGHVWDSVICPGIFSLIKQVDRLAAETTAMCESYFAQIVQLVSSLVGLVPATQACRQVLSKKWNLVAANVHLKLKDYERVSDCI